MENLPSDALLSIFLHLEDSTSDVFAFAGVCERVRSIFLSRNFASVWCRQTLPRMIEGKAWVAFVEEDFMGTCIPSAADVNLDAYREFLRGSMMLGGPEEVRAFLNDARLQRGATCIALHLGKGRWGSVHVRQRHMTPNLRHFILRGVSRQETVICQSEVEGHQPKGAGFPSLWIPGLSSVAWESVPLGERNHFRDFVERVVGGPTLAYEVHRVTLESNRYFRAMSVSAPGTKVLVQDCEFTSLSCEQHLFVDRGAFVRVEQCTFRGGHVGIFAFDAVCDVRRNEFLASENAGVVVRLPSLGDAEFILEDNTFRDVNDAIRFAPCLHAHSLRLCAIGNRIHMIKGTAIDCHPILSQEAAAVNCVGQHVSNGIEYVLERNVISGGHYSAIYINPPCDLSSRVSCYVRLNEISSFRLLGIQVALPPSGDVSGLVLEGNSLTDTAESAPIDASVSKCLVEDRICSRNVTGKRYFLQPTWNCIQCGLTDEENLGCCSSCAYQCHAGHEGIFLVHERGFHFCDCPECPPPAKCKTFVQDPPLLDIAPREYSIPKPKVL